MRKLLAICLLFLLMPQPAASARQADQKVAIQPPAIPMPPDRAEDSYAIYSMLMPGREFQDSTATKWVIADKTTSMNDTLIPPATSIWPPKGHEDELRELVQDFAAHQNETVHLTADGFKLRLPFSLLTEEQTRLYGRNISGSFFLGQHFSDAELDTRREVVGAPGLNSFSEVYFNAHHTMAMVMAAQNCGPTCGAGYWVVLGCDSMGKWQDLKWMSPGWMA